MNVGPACAECGKPADWAISVMGVHPNATATLYVCEQHATFYLQQGQAIYPAERIWPSRAAETPEQGRGDEPR